MPCEARLSRRVPGSGHTASTIDRSIAHALAFWECRIPPGPRELSDGGIHRPWRRCGRFPLEPKSAGLR